MQTGWTFFTTVALILAVLPGISRADDWSSHSPAAFGEPMENCAPRDPTLAIAGETPPAKDGLVQPAAIQPEPAVAAPAAETRAQLQGRPIPMATLLTFALMASSGSSLPQNPGPAK